MVTASATRFLLKLKLIDIFEDGRRKQSDRLLLTLRRLRALRVQRIALIEALIHTFEIQCELTLFSLLILLSSNVVWRIIVNYRVAFNQLNGRIRNRFV